jgi:putative tRNA adenosine deaminase-associated protein
VSYFAVALSRTETGWSGEEIDLDDVVDLEALTDLLRDLTGDGDGPALLLLEEDDEYVAVVRVDGGAGGLDEPRVFLSDRRAVQNSDVAAMLWEEADPDEAEGAEDDDDESSRPVAEPVGDTDLLSDLGTPAQVLLTLCASEGTLPADVLTAVCERAGCLDQLEELREG